MEYLYSDDYPDDDDNAPDPNDGNVKIDGDICSHCGGSNTERIDTISSEPVIWVCQCGSCGETFELLVKP